MTTTFASPISVLVAHASLTQGGPSCTERDGQWIVACGISVSKNACHAFSFHAEAARELVTGFGYGLNW
jgi:hypothetical protein